VAGVGLTMHWAGIGVTPWQLAPALAVTGIGMGLLMAPFFDIVLAGVEPQETGSASGALTAVQQLGGALGIAALGTVFFAVLAGHVPTATDAVAPALRAELSTVGVPAPVQDQIVAGLRACGHDHAVAKDAAATPASCDRLAATARTAGTSAESGAVVKRAIMATAQDAQKRAFNDAMTVSIWLEAAMLAVTFVVSFLLPRRARPEETA
jgi:hypothetical protein